MSDPVHTVRSRCAKSHRRFILLAPYRSGSNMLATAIAAHRDAMMLGELMNLETLAERPEQFIGPGYVNAFFQRDFGKPVVGFKFMYGQASTLELDESYWGPNLPARIANQIKRVRHFMAEHGVDSWSHLEEQLVHERSLCVIHLSRENALASYVSFQLALIEDNWIGKSYATCHRLRLDLAELEQWFVRDASQSEYYRARFAEHPAISLTYESLVGDFSHAMMSVARFLELDDPSAKQCLIPRQQTRALHEVVANYDEARAHFASTVWERFFEPGSNGI